MYAYFWDRDNSPSPFVGLCERVRRVSTARVGAVATSGVLTVHTIYSRRFPANIFGAREPTQRGRGCVCIYEGTTTTTTTTYCAHVVVIRLHVECTLYRAGAYKCRKSEPRVANKTNRARARNNREPFIRVRAATFCARPPREHKKIFSVADSRARC